jgi:hypothetical protein
MNSILNKVTFLKVFNKVRHICKMSGNTLCHQVTEAPRFTKVVLLVFLGVLEPWWHNKVWVIIFPGKRRRVAQRKEFKYL